MINFQYERPTTIKAALQIISNAASANIIAGGTNLIDLMKRGVTSPQRIVDINRLPLKNIEIRGAVLHIGALALNSEVSEHSLIKQHAPLLSMAMLAGASPQLRNMATVGGNILQRTRCTYFYDTVMPCNKRQPGSGCGALEGYNRMHAIFGASDQCIAVHPSDMCVALAALDAVVIIENSKGNRRIPFSDFHRLPGVNPTLDHVMQKNELITAVEIPLNKFTNHVHYLKIRDRASYAFALVSVAAALKLDNDIIKDVRLSMGGVAHKPWRLIEAEKFLKGKSATQNNFDMATKLAMQGAKAYRNNAFKLKLAPATISEALKKAATQSYNHG